MLLLFTNYTFVFFLFLKKIRHLMRKHLFYAKTEWRYICNGNNTCLGKCDLSYITFFFFLYNNLCI